MEPSQVFGDSEECHSSESGWTMYIGSPIDDSSDEPTDNGEDDDGDGDYATDANNEDDSDDSMASDASSGPSHQGHPFGNGIRKNQHGLALFNHQNDVKFCLENKAKKPTMEKKQRSERKEEKEELVLMGKREKGSVQSSSKVRKSIWMSKRNN